MDLTTTPTPTTTPDTDNDTPPHTHQVKHFSYANGTLKKHHYPYHHHHQQQQHHHHHHHLLHQSPFGGFGIYRECLKNHAASLGGHALDGCGEFMASPTANPMDPASLKCAACGCHRNFHRREPDAYSPSNTMIPHFLDFRHPPGRSSPSPSPPPPPPPPPQPTQSFAPHMLLALSSAAHDDQQGPNHHQVATPVTPTAIKSENLSGRKRFRTKFTQEQKEKMHSFSEKLGWKLQKCDDAMVEDFCNEIGVARGVLKVWMHNNKNTLGKKDIISNNNDTSANINNNDHNNTNTNTNTNTISGGRVSFENGSSHNNSNNNNEESNHNASHYHNETEVDAVHLHASTNASSSSS